MPDQTFDVLAIGNAIVDILARTEEDFLVREGLTKGMMRLIETDEAERLYSHMGPAIEASGGSAGNTAAGIASFGARAAYIGKVADDTLGAFFRHDINAIGVHFQSTPLIGGDPTARSMILITPDGERTMNTYLGACQSLTEEDIDPAVVAGAAITYMEGYLWDRPTAKDAFRKASRIAHGAGRLTAFTLSDSFCVDRFRPEFLELAKSGTMDIVFANESELKALYQTAYLGSAMMEIRADARLAVVTLGEEGAVALRGEETFKVPAFPVAKVEDATGAGDQFAAGFLVGYTAGKPLDDCTRLGCLAAAEVISHIGPRPAVSLKALATEHGLL
jgi:sugar/nucleoside kinase (ribokinase family)